VRIVAGDCRDASWSLEPRASARGRDATRTSTIIAVTTDTGTIGLGEAAPLPAFSPDTLADAHAAVRALAARLPLELPTPHHASAIADRITPAPAARFAIETALLAAYAQTARTSIAQLLAPLPQAELDNAVVVDDASDIPAGARCIKIKLADADIARAHRIAAAAPHARIRIDANRAWPIHDVDRILHALIDLPIDYVEEPCADAHTLLACDLPVRLALDESLLDLDAAALARALTSPRLAALVLKPTLLGGFARCLELAAAAHEHGVAPVITHTLEGPIGTAACTELARAVAADVPVGLAPHPALDHFTDASWSR
jgi:O-succinylbenzoate synthase